LTRMVLMVGMLSRTALTRPSCGLCALVTQWLHGTLHRAGESELSAMRAMLLDAAHRPLRAAEVPAPEAPGPGQVLIEVATCGVCRTDLHLLDGEVDVPDPPVIPGHQIVGR